jgi:hypothetical protein
VLPQLATTSDGDIYVLSQGERRLDIHRLDERGKFLGATGITAAQGSLATAGNGTIVAIYSVRSSGVGNRVYITGFDKALHRMWTVPTPLIGKGGRTYQIIAVRNGFVAIGETEGAGTAMLIGIDNFGHTTWHEPTTSELSPPRLFATKMGFYIVDVDPPGFVITKKALSSN